MDTFKADGCNIVYSAAFIDPADYEKLLLRYSGNRNGKHGKRIRHPHMTVIYHPDVIPYDLIGEKINISVYGYASDENNEGVGVHCSCSNPVLSDMLGKIRNPHITLSLSENGRAVHTGNLEFLPCEPTVLTAVFGFFADNGIVYIK